MTKPKENEGVMLSNVRLKAVKGIHEFDLPGQTELRDGKRGWTLTCRAWNPERGGENKRLYEVFVDGKKLGVVEYVDKSDGFAGIMRDTDWSAVRAG